MIATSENIYGGVIIVDSTLPDDGDSLKNEIEQLLGTLNDKKLLWIRIPFEKSALIPVLTSLDFRFHHCDEEYLMLVRRLTFDAFVPTSRNYIAGVGAIVLSKGKLLVVRDRFSGEYKIPGGHIDRNESLKGAVKREVYEETGIEAEFESILNVGHFRHGQFGESNLYIVCTAKPLSVEISVNDSSEIAEALWMDPHDFIRSENVNNYNKSVVEAAISNKELKLTERHIKLRVADGEVFF